MASPRRVGPATAAGDADAVEDGRSAGVTLTIRLCSPEDRPSVSISQSTNFSSGGEWLCGSIAQ